MTSRVTAPEETIQKNLTERTLKSLKSAPAGQRYEVYDTSLPAFAARVDDRGRIAFTLMKRINGKLRRWTLGKYTPGANGGKPVLGGMLSLAQARKLAWEVIDGAARGIDLRDEQNARERELARREKDTFASVAEEYIKRHVSRLRSAGQIEAVIRRHLIPRWASRPVTEIGRRDVVELVEAIADAGNRYAAHKTLAIARTLFGWAVGRTIYGLEHSPCDRLKPRELIGAQEARQRVLSDDELRVVWHAAEQLGYPFGPFILLLMISGQRREEVAGMRWSEVDLDKALWTIPPARMKGDAAHEVPLPPLAVELLDSLPRFEGNGCVFTTTGGKRPVSGFSKSKRRLDQIIAAEHGEEMAGWRYHDLRRSVRTHLAGLGVSPLICELILAHAQPTLHKTYDLYRYRDEKRRALELWAARLLSIVEPPPANVVPMRAAERGAERA